MAKQVHYTQLPTLDFTRFTQGTPQEKQVFAQELGEACVAYGFAIIDAHPLRTELREQLYRAEEQFFALPDEIKQTYERPEFYGERGYVGKKKERAARDTVFDLKEFYSIGRDIPSYESAEEDFIENNWPFELAEFRTVSTQVYEILYATSRTLLQAIALWLKLDEHYFDAITENSNHSLLRMLHYYPLTLEQDGVQTAQRAAPHTDVNLISLLMGATAPGLQIAHSQQQWIDIPPLHDKLVVSIGDMLDRLTNGRLQATMYRVINPEPSEAHTHRYSAPFYMHPHSDLELSPLPGCSDAQHPPQYEIMTAGAFLDERLRELGLKY